MPLRAILAMEIYQQFTDVGPSERIAETSESMVGTSESLVGTYESIVTH